MCRLHPEILDSNTLKDWRIHLLCKLNEYNIDCLNELNPGHEYDDSKVPLNICGYLMWISCEEFVKLGYDNINNIFLDEHKGYYSTILDLLVQ